MARLEGADFGDVVRPIEPSWHEMFVMVVSSTVLGFDGVILRDQREEDEPRRTRLWHGAWSVGYEKVPWPPEVER